MIGGMALLCNSNPLFAAQAPSNAKHNHTSGRCCISQGRRPQNNQCRGRSENPVTRFPALPNLTLKFGNLLYILSVAFTDTKLAQAATLEAISVTDAKVGSDLLDKSITVSISNVNELTRSLQSLHSLLQKAEIGNKWFLATLENFVFLLIEKTNIFTKEAISELERGLQTVDGRWKPDASSLKELNNFANKLLHGLDSPDGGVGFMASQLSSYASIFQTYLYSKGADLSMSVKHLISAVVADLAVQYGSLSQDERLVAATLIATVAGAAVFSVSSISFKGTEEFIEGQSLPLRYNPDAINAYFRTKPSDIVLRALQVALRCSVLTANVILDIYTGKQKENERLRATQLVDLITGLGPTAIKIGQALSIRPDILPLAYLEELQKLQDRVPPFSNQEAKMLIQEGLGKSADELFSEFSEEPIAAASLGQVYKARLRKTGKEVAVKVQRPGVLEGISRDLFLLRAAAALLQTLPNINSDFVALLDNWAFRFFDELDYVQEGKNQLKFASDMRELPNVVVPKVYMDYTSRKVLTTEWIQGEKLSESSAADLLPLIAVALNCYLMQLLESGFLHADPHPGNLLRTHDGRLCVLDFGLMTEVTEDQRYTFVEYISHLVNSDYSKVADDLVRLGFVPPELVDPVKTVAVVPQLSRVLGELVQGGGARKINFQQITNDLAKISEDYVFVIPPYFALILRAFSVLEGIGLDANPDYAIVDECYPYIAKRLLTDDSPRARATLKYFLYAGNDQLDVQRVEDMILGFQAFRQSMAPINSGNVSKKITPGVDSVTKEALLTIFAPEGSFLQELLLAELVRSIDALSREALSEFWRFFALRIPFPAALSMPGTWPIPLPGFFLGIAPVATLSEEDQKSLETVRRLWIFVEPWLFQQITSAELQKFAVGSIPLMRDLFPGVITVVQRFIVMLLQRQALRLADDLDGRDSIRVWNRDPAVVARQIRPIRLLPKVNASDLSNQETPKGKTA